MLKMLTKPFRMLWTPSKEKPNLVDLDTIEFDYRSPYGKFISENTISLSNGICVSDVKFDKGNLISIFRMKNFNLETLHSKFYS